jgi:hypothetical protein
MSTKRKRGNGNASVVGPEAPPRAIETRDLAITTSLFNWRVPGDAHNTRSSKNRSKAEQNPKEAFFFFQKWPPAAETKLSQKKPALAQRVGRCRLFESASGDCKDAAAKWESKGRFKSHCVCWTQREGAAGSQGGQGHIRTQGCASTREQAEKGRAGQEGKGGWAPRARGSGVQEANARPIHRHRHRHKVSYVC